MIQQKGSRLLYSCLNMRRQLNKLISNGDLSQGEYLVLRNIWLSNNGMSSNQGHIKAADLSDILKLSRPSITRILNDLERRGLITRNIDSEDRRSVKIELTEEGIEAIEKANRRILSIAERLVVSLGDSDTDKLIELIDKLTEIYKELFESSGDRSDE
ncbi:MAG TPA: MarR family transcriptional regulator [Clostridiaceae bacterium]|nr:MarR family transcriptional regulator [Clostridiaceae bacterium]